MVFSTDEDATVVVKDQISSWNECNSCLSIMIPDVNESPASQWHLLHLQCETQHCPSSWINEYIIDDRITVRKRDIRHTLEYRLMIPDSFILFCGVWSLSWSDCYSRRGRRASLSHHSHHYRDHYLDEVRRLHSMTRGMLLDSPSSLPHTLLLIKPRKSWKHLSSYSCLHLHRQSSSLISYSLSSLERGVEQHKPKTWEEWTPSQEEIVKTSASKLSLTVFSERLFFFLCMKLLTCDKRSSPQERNTCQENTHSRVQETRDESSFLIVPSSSSTR
jgi:hypothetical protein